MGLTSSLRVATGVDASVVRGGVKVGEKRRFEIPVHFMEKRMSSRKEKHR